MWKIPFPININETWFVVSFPFFASPPSRASAPLTYASLDSCPRSHAFSPIISPSSPCRLCQFVWVTVKIVCATWVARLPNLVWSPTLYQRGKYSMWLYLHKKNKNTTYYHRYKSSLTLMQTLVSLLVEKRGKSLLEDSWITLKLYQ